MEEWFRNPGNMVIAMFAALFLMGIARLPRILAWFQRVQMMLASPFHAVLGWPRAGRTFTPQEQRAVGHTPAPVAAPAVVPGAGRALLNPPGVTASIEYMRRRSPQDRYLLPLGWCRSLTQKAGLVYTALVGETNHLLISGASDSGKDNLAWWMLLSLGLAHPDPAQFQVAILDGKGLDFQPWAGKAQTWALASDPEEIPGVLRALSAERQRRKALLSAAGVSKWDHYQDGDLPLLVVFISELSLVETALKRERSRRDRDRALDLDLELWLNTELTAGRAFGIRYLIGMQTVTGMDMLWRSQVGVFVGGYQPDESQVKPNTSKTPKQIAAAGAIPPNQLPVPPNGAGVFTIVSGEQCATVRAPYLSDAERRRWLALLPERPTAPTHLSDHAPEALLAQLIASERVTSQVGVAATPTLPAEAAAATFLGEDAGSVRTPTSLELPFTAREVAVIAARIARGETKTEVVRSMPGYATRRHRDFVGYYEVIAAALTDAGLLLDTPHAVH